MNSCSYYAPCRRCQSPSVEARLFRVTLVLGLQHYNMMATMTINSTAGIAGATHSEVSLSITVPIAPMPAANSL